MAQPYFSPIIKFSFRRAQTPQICGITKNMKVCSIRTHCQVSPFVDFKTHEASHCMTQIQNKYVLAMVCQGLLVIWKKGMRVGKLSLCYFILLNTCLIKQEFYLKSINVGQYYRYTSVYSKHRNFIGPIESLVANVQEK